MRILQLFILLILSNVLYSMPEDLYWALVEGKENVVQEYLDRGLDVNRVNRVSLRPLHIAAKSGHIFLVKLLLKNGANPASTEAHGRTTFDYARKHNQYEIAEYIVKYDADVYDEFGEAFLKKLELDSPAYEDFRLAVRWPRV